MPAPGWRGLCNATRRFCAETSATLEQGLGKGHGCEAMKAPVGLLSHKAVLRKQDGAAPPRQTWGLCTLHKPVFHRHFCRSICFSGATWLDLPNLVARTEYHSRLVLSTLILRFFSQNRCTAGISALFLHSAQRNPLALEENPLVIYCFLKWFLLL